MQRSAEFTKGFPLSDDFGVGLIFEAAPTNRTRIGDHDGGLSEVTWGAALIRWAERQGTSEARARAALAGVMNWRRLGMGGVRGE